MGLGSTNNSAPPSAERSQQSSTRRSQHSDVADVSYSVAYVHRWWRLSPSTRGTGHTPLHLAALLASSPSCLQTVLSSACPLLQSDEWLHKTQHFSCEEVKCAQDSATRWS